jgi:succinyl-CoA synthetase beta subunit
VDLNPVVVHPKERGAVALDALITVEASASAVRGS